MLMYKNLEAITDSDFALTIETLNQTIVLVHAILGIAIARNVYRIKSVYTDLNNSKIQTYL